MLQHLLLCLQQQYLLLQLSLHYLAQQNFQLKLQHYDQSRQIEDLKLLLLQNLRSYIDHSHSRQNLKQQKTHRLRLNHDQMQLLLYWLHLLYYQPLLHHFVLLSPLHLMQWLQYQLPLSLHRLRSQYLHSDHQKNQLGYLYHLPLHSHQLRYQRFVKQQYQYREQQNFSLQLELLQTHLPLPLNHQQQQSWHQRHQQTYHPQMKQYLMLLLPHPLQQHAHQKHQNKHLMQQHYAHQLENLHQAQQHYQRSHSHSYLQQLCQLQKHLLNNQQQLLLSLHPYHQLLNFGRQRQQSLPKRQSMNRQQQIEHPMLLLLQPQQVHDLYLLQYLYRQKQHQSSSQLHFDQSQQNVGWMHLHFDLPQSLHDQLLDLVHCLLQYSPHRQYQDQLPPLPFEIPLTNQSQHLQVRSI